MVWQVGADHLDVKIDTVVDAMAMLLSTIVGRTPRFRVLHFLGISTLHHAGVLSKTKVQDSYDVNVPWEHL